MGGGLQNRCTLQNSDRSGENQQHIEAIQQSEDQIDDQQHEDENPYGFSEDILLDDSQYAEEIGKRTITVRYGRGDKLSEEFVLSILSVEMPHMVRHVVSFYQFRKNCWKISFDTVERAIKYGSAVVCYEDIKLVCRYEYGETLVTIVADEHITNAAIRSRMEKYGQVCSITYKHHKNSKIRTNKRQIHIRWTENSIPPTSINIKNIPYPIYYKGMKNHRKSQEENVENPATKTIETTMDTAPAPQPNVEEIPQVETAIKTSNIEADVSSTSTCPKAESPKKKKRKRKPQVQKSKQNILTFELQQIFENNNLTLLRKQILLLKQNPSNHRIADDITEIVYFFDWSNKNLPEINEILTTTNNTENIGWEPTLTTIRQCIKTKQHYICPARDDLKFKIRQKWNNIK